MFLASLIRVSFSSMPMPLLQEIYSRIGLIDFTLYQIFQTFERACQIAFFDHNPLYFSF